MSGITRVSEDCLKFRFQTRHLTGLKLPWNTYVMHPASYSLCNRLSQISAVTDSMTNRKVSCWCGSSTVSRVFEDHRTVDFSICPTYVVHYIILHKSICKLCYRNHGEGQERFARKTEKKENVQTSPHNRFFIPHLQVMAFPLGSKWCINICCVVLHVKSALGDRNPKKNLVVADKTLYFTIRKLVFWRTV